MRDHEKTKTQLIEELKSVRDKLAIVDVQGKSKEEPTVSMDTTNRRLAEAKLKASEHKFKSFIEITGQLGWTTNAIGEVEEDIPSWREFTGQTCRRRTMCRRRLKLWQI